MKSYLSLAVYPYRHEIEADNDNDEDGDPYTDIDRRSPKVDDQASRSDFVRDEDTQRIPVALSDAKEREGSDFHSHAASSATPKS